METHPSPGYTGDSFLYFNDLRLRVTSSHGLIFWTGGKNLASDFIMLGIQQGKLELSFNLGSGGVVLKYNSTIIDDGLWHRVRANRLDQTAST